MRRVADKFLDLLAKQLSEKKITLDVAFSAKEWLIKKGFDDKNGARPLARVIQEYIKKPLAEEMLFGQLTKGGRVRISAKDGKLLVVCRPPLAPRKSTKTEEELMLL